MLPGSVIIIRYDGTGNKQWCCIGLALRIVRNYQTHSTHEFLCLSIILSHLQSSFDGHSYTLNGIKRHVFNIEEEKIVNKIDLIYWEKTTENSWETIMMLQRMRFISFGLLIFLYFSSIVSESSVENDQQFCTIETESGRIRGKSNSTLLLRKLFYSFRGIPFAKPPINDLRFKVNRSQTIFC